MKKLCVIFILFFMCIPSISFSAATTNSVQIVELEWGDSPSPDVTGYRVYRAIESKGYDFTKPIGTVQKTQSVGNEGNTYTYKDVIDVPFEGVYFYVVTATDGINISEPSNEVSTKIDTIPPVAPRNVERKTYIKLGDKLLIIDLK